MTCGFACVLPLFYVRKTAIWGRAPPFFGRGGNIIFFSRSAILSSFTWYKSHFCISNRYFLKNWKVNTFVAAREGILKGVHDTLGKKIIKRKVFKFKSWNFLGLKASMLPILYVNMNALRHDVTTSWRHFDDVFLNFRATLKIFKLKIFFWLWIALCHL